MIRIFLPLILAALGFAAASCSQSVAPFAPTEAPASAQPTAHDTAAADAAVPSQPETVADSKATAAQASDAPASTPSAGSPSSASKTAADPGSGTSMPVERRASTLIGMPVASPDGAPVGEVKDIIIDRQGRATHLVISSTPDGKLTAMPWDAALAIIKDGKLVLDAAKLQGAPSFTADAWPNLDDPGWSAAADAYWRKAVRAAIAAHPGNPIDSTARQRGRRSRDSDGDGN